MRIVIATVCASVLLAACAHSPEPRAGASEIFAVPAQGEVVADDKLAKQPVDLLIPGWSVQATQLDEDRYRIELRMRTLITGGDGEARVAFQRSAREIVDTGGFASYDVLRYEEGIDSGFLFGRRSATGVIRVVRSQTWRM